MSAVTPTIAKQEAFVNGYIPPAVEDLYVSDRLDMDRTDEPVDDVAYEVLRNKFWNINMEHQETIRHTSGSTVVVQGWDLNSSILTETGDGVVFGPGSIFFAGCADAVVKWTIENRADNPGIHAGDVFIQDDPWIGTNHQMDTAVFRPVFVDDKLFAWIYNVAHQREVGGLEPGGFVQSAKDVFAEATFWPPTKIAERGVVRDDIVDVWVRRSRMPGLMTVEVKAQIAGANQTHDRFVELIERFGASAVKGAMRRTIRDASKSIGERLRSIPDGLWKDVRYGSGCQPGDRSLHRFEMTYEKRGDQLLVSNEGTDPAIGSFNTTAGAFRAIVGSSLLLLAAHDQYLCGGGLLPNIQFRFAENAINSARWPAAISTGMGLVITCAQAHYLSGKMLSAGRDTSRHVFAASGEHTAITNTMFGTDREGRYFSAFPFDGCVGAVGAFPWRDGIHHGGTAISALNPVGSVESYEQETPFLYLYRREVPHSGGHGQYRGGATFVSGLVGHKSDDVYISSGGLNTSVTQGNGLCGGLPSTGGRMWHGTDTSIQQSLADGRLPSSPEALRELDGALGPATPKKFDNRLSTSDVFEVMPQPGAGFGDPVLRSLSAVQSDLDEERVSPEDALRLYGVSVTADGKVDASASEQSRRDLVAQRVALARPPRLPAAEETATPGDKRVTHAIAVEQRDGQPSRLACAHCSRVLAEGSASYRLACHEYEVELPSISDTMTDPRSQIDDELVLRLFLCPGCGISLDSAICRPEDESFQDVKLMEAKK